MALLIAFCVIAAVAGEKIVERLVEQQCAADGLS